MLDQPKPPDIFGTPQEQESTLQGRESRTVCFIVWGSPVAQPRAKFRNIPGKNYPVVVSNPKKAPITQWKADIKSAYQNLPLFGDPPLSGPLKVAIDIFLPRPKRLMRRRDPDGPVLHIAKPDRDNVEKAILDALKGVAFVDDCQVCAGEVRKFYHEKDGRPRAEIEIKEIT